MNPNNNCPFYGYAMFINESVRTTPFVLLYSGGNQCGMLRDRITPCYMEQHHAGIDWRECPIVRDVRLGNTKEETE